MRPSRMTGDKDGVRRSAVIFGMSVNPVERVSNVGGLFCYAHVRHEAVVGRDKNVAFIHECLRFLLHVCLVTTPPATAVNP